MKGNQLAAFLALAASQAAVNDDPATLEDLRLQVASALELDVSAMPSTPKALAHLCLREAARFLV